MAKEQSSSEPPARKAGKKSNVYSGYTIRQGDLIGKVSDPAEVAALVQKRQPARLTMPAPIDVSRFKSDQIVATLDYKEILQVERKTAYGFGLGRERERLTFDEIVQRIKQDDSYYLTTQYEHDSSDEDADEEEDEEDEEADEEADEEGDDSDDESDEELDEPKGTASKPAKALFEAPGDMLDDYESDLNLEDLRDDYEDLDAEAADDALDPDSEQRIRTLLQPPLTNLVEDPDFPIVPEAFANLIPQQVNLWMGSSKPGAKPDLMNPTVENLGRWVPEGNSSGLHHDHADNLYLLVEGRKRFTLYAPSDAEHLFTVGTIKTVFENGLIDYHTDRNAPHWRAMRADGAIWAEWARWKLASLRSLQDGRNHDSVQEKELEDIIASEVKYHGPVSADLDPPSFSKVPPVLCHLDELEDAEAAALRKFAEQRFPGFLGLRKLEVWLEAGDMLYLPTGWFHEVTSFGDGGVHTALNWWFVPPTGNDVRAPYPDQYWLDDYDATKAAVQALRGAP